MLSSPRETYGPNKIVLAVVALLGLGGLYLAYAVRDPKTDALTPGLLVLVLVAPFVAIFIWLLSVGVTFHEDGITYKSWFGTREIRWGDVERFYFRAAKRSINFVPIGTYYYFKLRDRQGGRLSFGNRIAHPSEVGAKLIEYTFKPLLTTAAQAFDSGAELDFGEIRVSRGHGLKVKKPARWYQIGTRVEEIPWNEVADYRIADGCFYVWRVGQKRTTGPEISRVPNAFVLKGLLDAVLRPER
ncbi:MAG: PH domain-containing protein [Terriglobia bacterium]